MKSDNYLIRKIMNKDSQQATEELVRRYYDPLYFFLFQQIGQKEDTLDVTQEVFIAALNSLPAYDTKKASFKTWLFQIGVYKVIDLRRRKKIHYEELTDFHWVEDNNMVDILIDQELLQKITDYVAQFHPEVQEVFQLKIYGELSFKEIASLQDEKEEKIKAQYYRLIKKIRKEFAHHAI